MENRSNAARQLDNIRKATKLAWNASPYGVAGALALATVVALVPPAAIWLSQQLVDIVAEAAVRQVTVTDWAPLAGVLGLVFATQRVFQIVQANNEQRFAEQVAQHANRRFNEKAAQADMQYLDDPDWHDRMARAARSLNSRPVSLVRGLIQLESALVTVLGTLGVLFALDPLLVIIGLAPVLLSVPHQRYQTREIYRLFYGVTRKERERFYTRSLLTDVRPAKEVRALGLGPHLLDRHDRLVDRWIADLVAVLRRANRYAVGIGIVSGLILAAAYVFIVSRGVAGQLSPGTITATIAAFGALTSQLGVVSHSFSDIEENAKFLEDYFSFLAIQPLIVKPGQPTRLPARLEDGIRFKNVCFSYMGGTRPALDNLNLHVRSGEMMAVVGVNGAGKTTLIRLLLRLYDPDAGTVRLGGVDLRDADPAEVRSRIGILFEDFTTFELTARENVTFGRVDHEASDAEVLAALQAAQASDIVRRLPNGLDSNLGRLFDGGQDLSGGQKQRLALARLIFRDADVWILDEPTSALDAEGEAAIFAQFRQLLHGRTGIVVSHRFSTVRIADRIAVMEGGRIVELGTHEELLARGGRYAQWFELQAAGYR